LDEDGWYSATPEPIAQHLAARVREIGDEVTVLDAYVGVGSNLI